MRLLPLLTAIVLLAALAPAAAAQAPTGTKMACTNGPDFQLTAGPGRVSLPDGNDMYMWSYGNRAGADAFQLPGPVLCVTQGQQVTVSLLNNLPGTEPTSLSFPWQSDVRSAGGTGGLLGPEVAPGQTITYTFTASEPGTYLYESGTNPHKQVHMGLYGALVVRPSRGPDYAYDDAATRFDPNREYLMLIHDLDPELHRAVERGTTYDVTKKHDVYWTINGRSFPDTIADNGASWLPQQPYSSLITTRPYNETSNPLPALVRYVNAGFVKHPFHPHGNHMRLIAQDGRLLRGSVGADPSMEAFTRTLEAGQTYDLFFRWIDADRFDPNTNKVPVTVPSNRNLAFKDNASNYSGSPYLGRKSALPAGVTSYNQCGEYYFPLHSHALNEFGGAIGAIAWNLVTNDADRRRPLSDAAREAERVQDGRWRILVIANETLRGVELLSAIAESSRARPIVRVVAPVLPSRAHYLASDIDRELAEAGARLQDTLAWAGGIGLEVTGRVHSDTPTTAIEDELRSFAADELIISTHPPARSRWLESGLLKRVREELEIPVTHVVVDLSRQNADVETATVSY